MTTEQKIISTFSGPAICALEIAYRLQVPVGEIEPIVKKMVRDGNLRKVSFNTKGTSIRYNVWKKNEPRLKKVS